MAKTVFYSFHYKRDVHRVQLVKNINALEGQPVLSSQAWEQVERGGSKAIQQWIDEQMKYKRAVVVLIGRETASRPWVKYEVQKAWQDKKPLLGVRIHGLSSMGSVDSIGGNPFTSAGLAGVPIFDPTKVDWQNRIDSQATYRALLGHIEAWSSKGATRP
ncbi:TIR domain-containing protein [Nocardioides astragali]|uniref:TIR domain-containing protein n=1 Tax=Nocardioides astragali TaxID=1776736 RepID=A0ABW2N6V9_9ACTN|nr:TIR domain-containing protein [Nocardioides astragali]